MESITTGQAAGQSVPRELSPMFQAWQQDIRQCHLQQSPSLERRTRQGCSCATPVAPGQLALAHPQPPGPWGGVGSARGSSTALRLRQGCAGGTRSAPAEPAEPGEQVVMQTPGVAVRAPVPQFPPGCTPLLQRKNRKYALLSINPSPKAFAESHCSVQPSCATRATTGFPRAGAAPRTDVLGMAELSCSTCCQLSTPAHPPPALGRALGRDSSATKLGLGRSRRRSSVGPGWGDQGRVLPSSDKWVLPTTAASLGKFPPRISNFLLSKDERSETGSSQLVSWGYARCHLPLSSGNAEGTAARACPWKDPLRYPESRC